jgi:hypothetical protein
MNYLVDDNNNLYLTDFGLSLDQEFNLTVDELKFMKNNKKIDSAYLIELIYRDYSHRCARSFPIITKMNYEEGNKYLLDNMEELGKKIKITSFQKKFLIKNKKKIKKIIDWYEVLITGNKNNIRLSL